MWSTLGYRVKLNMPYFTQINSETHPVTADTIKDDQM